MTLAELEVARRETLRLDLLAQTHLHRAAWTDGMRWRHGRADLGAQALADAADGPQRVEIGADLGHVVAYAVTVGGRAWRGHRWVRREGDRVAAETVVEDGRAAALGRDPAEAARALAAAHPAHQPLGELRAGEGQLDAGRAALLAPGAPEAARRTADLLHRAVNGRAFDVLDTLEPNAKRARRLRDRLVALMAALPDLTLLFERAVADGPATAFLFRLAGHDTGGLAGPPTGRRAAALGSVALTPALGCDLVLDDTLLRASVLRPLIAY